MSLSRYSVTALNAEHIRSLIENGVRESRELDYKQSYSLRDDAQKKEFVRDVAAFANTMGGDLIFGVEETDGVASAIPGIPLLSEDNERLRIENLLTTAISPRLSGLGFKQIPLNADRAIFIVRVPRSLNAPHMATNGDNRFYGRHSSGRFTMDVHQVRDAFFESNGVSNRLRVFREERLRWIEQKEVGVRLTSPHLTVVHLLPLASLRGGSLFDGRALRKIDTMKLRPLRDAESMNEQLNLDGLRVYSSQRGGKTTGYVQLFRTGAIEVVDSVMLAYHKNVIPSAYERTVRDGVHRLIGILRELGLDGSTAICLSLLQVRGYSISYEREGEEGQSTIELDNLILPEVVVEGGATEAEVDTTLHSPFDLVWNACNKLGSPNYSADGTWKKEVDPFRSR